jgi:hypothetical protein
MTAVARWTCMSANHRSRREFLALGSGTVLGGSLLATSAKAHDTTRIVTERVGDKQIETKVPTKWWEHSKQVEKALQKAQRRFGNSPVIEDARIEKTEEKIAGLYKSRIGLTFNPDRAAQASEAKQEAGVPDQILSIPVRVSKARELKPASGGSGCPHFGGDRTKIRGGIPVVDADSGEQGTAVCRVWKNGNPFLLTCNHLGGGCNRSKGDRIDLTTGEKIGEIAHFDVSYDWMLVEVTNSNLTLTDTIVNPGHSQLPDGPLEVAGYYTKNGVKYLNSNDYRIFKQGGSTGLEEGVIYNLESQGSYDCANWSEGVETSHRNAPGDSGGPLYHKTDSNYGDVSIVSMYGGFYEWDSVGETECGNDVYDDAQTVAAYQIATNGDINFEEEHSDTL